jgi:pimeloyl-ACP methyl ester carboxylesterase
MAQWTAQMMRIPVYVTRGLRQGRSLENRDLLDSLDLPMALVVGGKDKSMPFEALQSLAETRLTQGEYWLFESAGHAVSTDAAEAFDARLLAFTKRVAK